MKTLAMLILVTLVGFATKGQVKQNQTATEGISFGLRFGGNLNSITGNDSHGNSLEKDSKIGASIGVNVEIPVAPNFVVQPGLLFSNKGTKSTETSGSQTATGTTYITYAEIPLYLLYKPALGPGAALLGVGPYAAYALGGKYTINPGGDNTIKFKNVVRDSDPDVPYLKAFDAGINMLIGYQFVNRFSVQLNGQFGLANINPKYEDEPDDKPSYKNIGFGISIGYRFHPRK
ncbi:MAG: porin family protein [Ferruginibacter sp.]